MQHEPDNAGRRSGEPANDGLEGRIDALASWMSELDGRLRAAELATGDEATAKELRRALEILAKHDPKLEKRLTDRVEVLADRHATLASTVSTTAAALARKDGELAALRRQLDESANRLEVLVHEHATGAGPEELEAIRAAIRKLESQSAPAADGQIDGLEGKVVYLGERIDTLAKTVATTAAGLAGRDGELAALRQRLNERSQQIEAAIADLRRNEAGELTGRIDELQTTVDSAASELVARGSEIVGLRRRIDEAYSRVGAVVDALQQSIEVLASRVGELEGSRDTSDPAYGERWSAAQVERVDGLAARLDEVASHTELVLRALGDERRQELEALEIAVANGDARLESAVVEVRHSLLESEARLDAMERERAAVAAELGAEVKRWSDTHEDVRTRLAILSAEVAKRDSAEVTVPDGVLAELTRRLDVAERDRETLAAAVAQTSEAWADVRSDFELRLDAVARQLDGWDGGESESSRVQEAEISRLRVAVDGLRMRLAAGEKQLAAVVGPQDVVPRLDALDRRLDALEQTTPGPIVAPVLGDGSSLSGEGRLRLELRALELRMEHAEEAARDNREAVLVQLERLAARIEWRFQRLEAARAVPAPEPEPEQAPEQDQVPAGGAQVIPIRGLEV